MPRLNTNKIGHVDDENRKSPNKASKLKKSISTNRKYSSKDQDRLAGGADVPEEKESEAQIETVPEESPVTPPTETAPKTEDGLPVRTPGPCCTCLASVPGSTGDKKVDEIIDYVHQNLQDAGKALATLGENFEHDLKLMFADILGRIKQWIGLVQNKLDICEKELEALRKELIARACEIENLKKMLAECEEREKIAAATQTERHERKSSVSKEETKEVEVSKEEEEEEAKDYDTLETDEDDGDKSREQIEIICTDAAIQAIMQDRDRLRREMELEAELARLRKENQRIIKERAEYENAIQRALLRGVSCLNVEALRVLRCPPIPCCTPCAPCPASTMESMMVCKKDASRPKSCVTQRAGSGRAREQCCLTEKRPCASPCCSGGKSRKSLSDNSMVFLLHQGDTENVCNTNAPMPRVCGAPAMKKIEIPPCPRFGR